MKKQSILVINRWNDETVRYENYIDHNQYNVFYLTNQMGEMGIRRELSTDVCVVDLDNFILDANIEILLDKISPIIKIIAFSEVDQELAALLRTKFSVSGIKFDEIMKFRNKVEMKRVAVNGGIQVPMFSDLNDVRGMNKLKDIIGYPLIIKPVNGVSSEGVYKISSEDELDCIFNTIDSSNYECEQFIDGKIYHADGLVYNDNIILFKVSEYINSCFDYKHGKPLGSVIIDDISFKDRTKKYTQDVIKAFSLHNGAYHLEFIIDKQDKIYFLEIGARVGGAQIPYVFQHVYGVNMFHEWVNIQVKNDVRPQLNKATNKYIGGWLLFPEPQNVPCTVEYTSSLKNVVPHILYEKLPDKGHVFNGGGEYKNVSGAYLYKGSSTNEVREAINQTINQFLLKTM